jgi:hypothetical protein
VADHPVKVPAELAEQLWSESADKPAECNTFRAHVFAQKIAEWAADQELRVSCDAIYLHEGRPLCGGTAEWLRTARRPKPPTLAEQGMEELELLKGDANSVGMGFGAPAITAALNRLAELEAQQ